MGTGLGAGEGDVGGPWRAEQMDPQLAPGSEFLRQQPRALLAGARRAKGSPCLPSGLTRAWPWPPCASLGSLEQRGFQLCLSFPDCALGTVLVLMGLCRARQLS